MYKISKFVSYGTVGDESLIYNFLTNTSVCVKTTSKFIWENIAAGLDFEDIVEKCCKKYNVIDDKEKVSKDVSDFIDNLEKLKIIFKE